MEQWLYKLTFKAGLHIGRHDTDNSLEDSQLTVHSDTLFSALCTEAVKMEYLEPFYELVDKGNLIFSDALPYQGENYYLPRPLLPDLIMPDPYQGIEFIALSEIEQFCKIGFQIGKPREYYQPHFGKLATDYRMHFTFSYWRFLQDCGLYIIVQANHQEALALWEALLYAVGFTGIGGKKSSGLGQFDSVKGECPSVLQKWLGDNSSERQMCLGVAYPKSNELKKILKNSSTSLLRRSGFVSSETYQAPTLQKKVTYLFAPGSCFPKQFDGILQDVSYQGSHPVWRLGKTLFLGLPA